MNYYASLTHYEEKEQERKLLVDYSTKNDRARLDLVPKLYTFKPVPATIKPEHKSFINENLMKWNIH